MLRASPVDETNGFGTSAEPDFVNLSGIPAEYHDFADVFSESEAYNLLPHREFNLKIETVDDAEPLVSPIYSLSATELTALWEFLDKNLKADFIYLSRSSHGALILFAKKKDGSLRLCVDYRGLNHITKKDHYPLPLIADLLDSPRKARIYTKLDLCHAYHLLRVAAGDEYKPLSVPVMAPTISGSFRKVSPMHQLLSSASLILSLRISWTFTSWYTWMISSCTPTTRLIIWITSARYFAAYTKLDYSASYPSVSSASPLASTSATFCHPTVSAWRRTKFPLLRIGQYLGK
jgi:hypothetical protein